MARRAPVHGRHEVAAPTGLTGYGGEYPSYADICEWKNTHADGNIGIRVPDTIVGIDVDGYIGKDSDPNRPRVPGRSRASLGQAAIRADIDQPPRRHLRYPVVSGQAGHQTQDDSFVRRQGHPRRHRSCPVVPPLRDCVAELSPRYRRAVPLGVGRPARPPSAAGGLAELPDPWLRRSAGHQPDDSHLGA